MNVVWFTSNSLVTKQGIANCKCQSLNNHRGIIRVICPHYPSSGFHPVSLAPGCTRLEGWPGARPIFPLTPDSESLKCPLPIVSAVRVVTPGGNIVASRTFMNSWNLLRILFLRRGLKFSRLYATQKWDWGLYESAKCHKSVHLSVSGHLHPICLDIKWTNFSLVRLWFPSQSQKYE